MAKDKKTAENNQWAGPNDEMTSRHAKKSATDNQWASCNKKK
ncbi:MAG: hypothetical protein ACI35O_13290 [Bacillaceae bacterium]